jgi:hypothetical protein
MRFNRITALFSCMAIHVLATFSQCVSQEFVILDSSNDSVQSATSYGKALIDDFALGMQSYASIVEARFHTSPDSVRLFESRARFERVEDKSIVWMKNTWNTDDVGDDRTAKAKTKSIPCYKNCSSEILISDSRLFEVVATKDLGTDDKPMTPKLYKRQPRELVCGYGVSTRDWPFVYESCFSSSFVCDDLLLDRFGVHSRCIAAEAKGKTLDSIWIGLESEPGVVKSINRIVFEDGLPILYEIRYLSSGYSIRPGKVKLDGGERISQVKTRWKKFDIFSVPEQIQAVFYTPGGNDGFEEMFVDAKINFFPSDSKEFLTAKESMDKLSERAKKLSESKKVRED